jgi:hypothetical protein
LFATHTELARLAVLANPNNGALHLLKTTPASCDKASLPEPENCFNEAKKNNATTNSAI